MTAPPGLEPVASAAGPTAVGEKPVDAARFAELMARATASPQLAHLGARTLQRRVRRFIEAEIRERYLIAWVISYADPTGETAVGNVMREAA